MALLLLVVGLALVGGTVADVLRAAGIPLVDRSGPDGDEAATLRRHRLAALLEDDGWSGSG